MLTIKKSVSLTGSSSIDNVIAARYTATIDSNNPSNMTVNTIQVNKSLYKENRETCRADQAEFEEYVYSLQDTMLSELNTEEEIEE